MNSKLNTPCYGCTDRSVGCHSECDAYRDYQKRNAERHKVIYNNHKAETQFLGYNKDKVKVLIRAKGERKK